MGCIVLVLGVGRCAFRPPRVVFVLGLVSLINSLTSGKKGYLDIPLPHEPDRQSHVSAAVLLCVVAWPPPDGASLDAFGSTAQTQRSALSARDCCPFFGGDAWYG